MSANHTEPSVNQFPLLHPDDSGELPVRPQVQIWREKVILQKYGPWAFGPLPDVTD